jgi:integrase
MTAIPRSKPTTRSPRLRFQPSDLYKTRICKAASGEEIPLLVSAESGLPVLRPNQFVLVARRDQAQISTLKGDLGSLAVLLSWAHHYALDLEEAIDRGSGLDATAIVSLVDALRVNYSRRKAAENVVNLKTPLVCPEMWASRIAIARDYLAWSLAEVLSKCEPGTLRYQHVRERRDAFIRAMNGRIPKTHSRSSRKGLEAPLRVRLIAVTAPESLENPYQQSLRERNSLMIDILKTLGLRRAELCKIRTSNFRPGPKPTLLVERLPDDPEDPRLHQPQVKTLTRLLPLEHRLAARIQEYILGDRKKLPNAKRTPFLFLARTGEPISLPAVNNIFDQIVLRHPEFDGLLTPHVLRHTANDELSETFEHAGCGQELAREVRNFLNGWDPDSTQGARYSATYIEAKATEISLAHQRRLFDKESAN